MQVSLKAVFAASILAPFVLFASSANARTYDCSKAGNANKTACKTAAASATPAAKPMGVMPKVVAVAPKPVAPAPTAMTAPASKHSFFTRSKPVAAPTAATATANAVGPQGATAKCRDGSYSKSAHHSGTCSHHGGVAQFY